MHVATNITATPQPTTPIFLTLSQLLSRATKAINAEFTAAQWVLVEVTNVTINIKSGHCYLELVEPDNKSTSKSQAKAVIWKPEYHIVTDFENATGIKLDKGINLLVAVEIDGVWRYVCYRCAWKL